MTCFTTPAKLLTISFISRQTYWSNSRIHLCGRKFCTSGSKRKASQETVDALLQWRKENKALYGDVIGKKVKPKTKRKASSKILPTTPMLSVPVTANKVSSPKTKSKPLVTQKQPDLYFPDEPANFPLVDGLNEDEIDVREMVSPESNTSNLDSLLLFPLFKPKPSGLTFQPVENLNLPDNLTNRPPGVTTVLKETMSPESRYFLERWEKKMIAELGMEGFQRLKQETFKKGKDLHTYIQFYLEGKEKSQIPSSPSIEGYLESIQKVLPEVSEVQFLEQNVSHPHLHYRGIVDCVARYRDVLCVIDWKTSKKQKADVRYTYDNPLQLAAYAGAVNFDDAFPTQIENSLVVIAYEDGKPAHAHLLSKHQCVQYWGDWLQRLHLYWTMKTVSQTQTQAGPAGSL